MSIMNPWASRFLKIDDDAIRVSTLRSPKRINDLDSYHVEVACKLIEAEYNSVFVPTTQVVQIINTLINVMIGHFESIYTDNKSFVQGCYSKDVPLPEFSFPICLTGLAGVGKSALIYALMRLFPYLDDIMVDEYHPPFQRSSPWFLDVNKHTKLSTMLASLLEENEGDGKKKVKSRGARHDIDSLRLRSRRKAYKTGSPLLTVDELQFLARSENANSIASKILITLSTLGIPFIFVANYSLVHKLKRRPQEDKQRLLSKPIVLLPDEPDSKDWIETLKIYRKVSPGTFNYDPVKDSMDIYRWTGGIKRLLNNLLIIAYRRARQLKKNVTITDLEWAFMSTEYSINRQDVLLLNKQYITNDCGRNDLICPFDLPESITSIFKHQAEEDDLGEIVSHIVKSSLTHDERKTYEKLQKAALSGNADIIPISSKRKKAINDLKLGEELLKQSLKSKKPK